MCCYVLFAWFVPACLFWYELCELAVLQLLILFCVLENCCYDIRCTCCLFCCVYVCLMVLCVCVCLCVLFGRVVVCDCLRYIVVSLVCFVFWVWPVCWFVLNVVVFVVM